MRPFDYYFSDPSLSLDHLDFEAPILTRKGKKELSLTEGPDLPSFSFQSDANFSLGACYRKKGNHILAASAFGAYRFHLPDGMDEESCDFDEGVNFNFKCTSGSGGRSSWTVKIKNSWINESAKEASPVWMRAKKIEKYWIPPYCSYNFRSSRGLIEYCEILLPSPAIDIKKINTGVLLKTEYHRFIIEDDYASKVILRGNVRWGFPQSDGFFKLNPHRDWKRW